MLEVKPVKDVYLVEFNDETNIFYSYDDALAYARNAYLPDVCKKILEIRARSSTPDYFIEPNDVDTMLSSMIRVPVYS